MVTLLKQISLAIGLLSSENATVALNEGWKGYVWRIKPVEQCLSVEKDGFCTLLRDRWDWKRDQRYQLAVRLNKAKNLVETRATLDNRDPDDDDNVCIAAVFYDRNGQEVAIDFQNIYAPPRKVTKGAARLKPGRPVSDIARVAIGSKQCDPSAADDQAIFAAVRGRIGQK